VFNWIYDVPPLLAIAVFGVTSVVVCWIGILISHRDITAWVHRCARCARQHDLSLPLQHQSPGAFAAVRPDLVLHRDNDLSDRDRGSSVRGQVGVSPEAFELVYEQIMLRF